MKEMIHQFAEVNQLYWNRSLFQWGFYISMFSIMVFERHKTKRMIFGLYPIVMLAALFNPVVSKVISLFFTANSVNLYYVRLFSVIPVFYCLAHGAVLVLEKMKGTIKLFGVCLYAALIICAGNNVCGEPWMRKAENIEKVPEEALAVMKIIPRKKDHVCVAFPDPLYVYARQIDANIIMPYGRETSFDLGPLFSALSEPVPDVSRVMSTAGGLGVDYIVVNKSDKTKAAFEEKGRVPVGETEGYLVYPVSDVDHLEQKYNEKNQIISVTTYDKMGNPKVNAQGYTTVAYEYDKWGNQFKETYFDNASKIFTLNSGYASIQKNCSFSGMVKSFTYLDENNQPVLVFGRYETRNIFDKDGRVIRESYFDQNGFPMNRTDFFYAVRDISCNRQGKIVSETYKDIQGYPVVSSSGYAGFTRKYDDNNNLVLEKYYGIDGSLVKTSDGFAGFCRTYDSVGNIIREIYIDEQGKECARSTGMTSLRREYDSKNRLVKETYWDASGNPCWLTSGYCGFGRTYDENGNIASETYLDDEGKEITIRAGYSRVERQYDDKKLVKEEYYAFEKPFMSVEGFASFSRSYDSNGNVETEVYYDKEHHMKKRSSGYAALARVYDNNNRVTKENYFDENGQPVKNTSGYAALEREYNSFSKVVREAFFDEKGNSVLLSGGYDEIQREYNEAGWLVKETYLAGGKSVNRTDTLYAGFAREYDDRGNVIRESYFDMDGNAVVRNTGYAAVTRKFNAMRQVVREDYFDEQNDPVLLPIGYASVLKDVDPVGNVIRDTFLDTEGKVTQRTDNIACIDRVYNEKRQLLEEYYLDMAGNGVLSTSGYAAFKRSYDHRNNIIREGYYGLDGQLTLRNTGYAYFEREYDACSNVVRESYFGTQGEKIQLSQGYDEVCREYNDRRQLIREEYRANGQLVNRTDNGRAIIVCTYDSDGVKLSETYYNSDNEVL